MSVKDHIKPVNNFVSGIPLTLRNMLRSLPKVGVGNGKPLSLALSLYEKQLKFIEAVMSGRCPVEREDKAAEIAAKLILDAAFVHQAIASTGYQIGDFPYDDLADIILPKPSDIADKDGNSERDLNT